MKRPADIHSFRVFFFFLLWKSKILLAFGPEYGLFTLQSFVLSIKNNSIHSVILQGTELDLFFTDSIVISRSRCSNEFTTFCFILQTVSKQAYVSKRKK